MPRPTGRSHTPQNRLLSATTGFVSTADAGSLAGTGGISTRPAPRWPRDDRPLPGRVRRLPEPRPVPVLPVPALPEPALPGPVPADGAEAGDGAGPEDAAGAAAAAGWAGSGASPQVSQYPPSMVPPQPGRLSI